MFIKIQTHFDAAHWLPTYEGDCRNVHGHTWKVIFTFQANPVTPENHSGMIQDFKVLKKYLKKLLVPFDHHQLNHIIENPTAELLAAELFKRVLDTPTLPLALNNIELFESADCSVVFTQTDMRQLLEKRIANDEQAN